MSVRVQAEDFDVAAELAAVRDAAGGVGGIVSFTGIVRDMAEGQAIASMTLEHYPGMTVRELERIEAEARDRWPLAASRVIHRFGTLSPGDNIVLVITASAHRQAAFEAAEFLVDWLKTRAPFWKQEATAKGPHWVEAKASDDDAAARWTAPPKAARSA